ncbi:hypothetical protein G647_06571 [Cladophialophora carrionii CBS 160.54]|uniref:Uncharacterized protein n=1 Tax=Cladophialophora carrionii CBS 160.54 TaxID=1279043 RepID=V9D784_9EURO|nr:uncharacterized protein G647_06571 [Cladophialophora carrionii CBS 160.54]ETI22496.1 hypothetical protein G647_06571 [Cladophialophora carrionii CBS 160.54]
MQVRAAQVILLILSLVLSVVILIASSKYAAWSHSMVSAAAGTWLPLVFYVGTIPFVSLLYTVAHLAALQFNGLPSPPYLQNGGYSYPKSNAHAYDADYAVTSSFFILCVTVLHTLAWLAQSILCTSCELAPILQGHQGLVPKWCPQSRFRDSGQPGLANMLGTLAPVKDFLQWVMVVLAAALIECARREYVRAEVVRRQQVRMMGAGVDFGGRSQGANAVVQTKTPGVELNEISGPQLIFRAEEEARRRQEEEERKQREEEKRNKQLTTGGSSLPPQPTGQGVSGNKDNYYGNGMGLKRSGTLNYMYESRVATGPAAIATEPVAPRPAQTAAPKRSPQPVAPPPPGKTDNYYGNATGLKRSGTLNYMYESRI